MIRRVEGSHDAALDADALRERLRAFVAHERQSGLRARRESYGQTIAERVESGDCVDRLTALATQAAGGIVLECGGDFHAKFREGDPLLLSTGEEVEGGFAVQFQGYDIGTRRVRVVPDRFEQSGEIVLDPGVEYCLDRRELGLDRLLHEGLDSLYQPSNEACVRALLGELSDQYDDARRSEARSVALERGLTESQAEAVGRIVGCEGVTLVQGPPGTGKTRVLAEAGLALAQKGCRIFVAGFTHRAVNNVLRALRALNKDVPLFKVGGGANNKDLHGHGITVATSLDRLRLPEGGLVVAGTPYAVRKFSAKRRFHFAFVDEAGQMPVVHGAIAMTAARRWAIVGDPAQLPPVRQGRGRDDLLGASLYAFLEQHGAGVLLEDSFRLNDELTRFVSKEFYAGRLRASRGTAKRRLQLAAWSEPAAERSDLAAVIDPESPLVLARIDHEGRTRRAPEEVECVADLVHAFVVDHRVPREEIAVLAPFRSQVRQIRHELERRGQLSPGRDDRLVVDTVERMQGQEREIVILSFAGSDRDDLARQAEFFYEPGRLNVALTRARNKCIVVASRHAFRARPLDLELLRRTAIYKRLAREIPVVDLTERYCGGAAPRSRGGEVSTKLGGGEISGAESSAADA